MTVPHRPLIEPLRLQAIFGARSPWTREALGVFHEALPTAGWHAPNSEGRGGRRAAKYLARLAARYGITASPEDTDRVLLALQTYYALLVSLVASRALGDAHIDLLPGNPYAWYSTSPSKAVQRFVERLTEAMANTDAAASLPDDQSGTRRQIYEEECDLFKGLYQNLFPRALRHQLGEYYTPDWLATHVLDQVGYTGDPAQRLLDPSCGSGTFLLMALRRLRAWRGEKSEESGEGSCDSPLSSLLSPRSPLPVGFDLNPLAVLTARANYLIAIADLLPKGHHIEVPVYLYDSILNTGVPSEVAGMLRVPSAGYGTGSVPATAESFDYVVGNPPWIAWDNLCDEDRQATKPLWERYGLFSLSGNEARHGGGKKDLSMLMLYAAADRYLKPAGRLGMVITQTLFQTKGAGDGFRRFRLGTDGPPLKVLRVDDMIALRPFDDAANWTSTIVLEKGAATEYPVPYFRWEKEKGDCPNFRGHRGEAVVDENGTVPFDAVPRVAEGGRGAGRVTHCLARPIDPSRPNSPWLIVDDSTDAVTGASLHPSSLIFQPSTFISRPSPYTAHLGANSGGANGVYWVDVLGAAEGGVRIRNIAARGKHAIASVDAVIEPDLLYPLVRWSDVSRYSAAASAHLILAQDPATRSGIDEAVMQERYPRTLRYLEQFRDLLAARAAYRRYQGKGPFYAMYNVGPYTTAPVKVVWRRMDRQINAAVIESVHDPLLGVRPPVPQETCVLLECPSSDEAHYICAVLNSAIVNELISGCSVRGGKGFGTPGMLAYIPLEQFDRANPRHVELATLGRHAHNAIRSADEYEHPASEVERIRQQIDLAAVALWHSCSEAQHPDKLPYRAPADVTS